MHEIEMAVACTVGDLGAWTLPPQVSCLEFVQEHGIVPSGARRGRLSFDRRPYQREVFEAYDGVKVHKITLVWCSQSGKSTIVLNILFFHVKNRPTAEMVVLPNKNSRNDFVDDRLRPAILGSPEWMSELLTGKIDNDLIQTKGRFKGGPLYMALAGSEADLAQRDCELVVNDEKDKQPAKTSKEGTPDEQAEARTRTFVDPMIVNVSTPTTIEGPINQDWLDSDRRLWHIRCPKCQTESPWQLKQLKRDQRPIDPQTGRKRSFKNHAQEIRRGNVAVWYEMPCCGHRIVGKREKDRLNVSGRYVATRPEVEDHAGFRITAFDIPDETFESIMVKFMEAQHGQRMGDERKMKIFCNHWLAQPFQSKRKQMVVESVLARIKAGTRRGKVPRNCEFVTIGADIQGGENGIYWVALGWTVAGPTLHVVDWGHIGGDFERVSALYDQVLMTEWEWQDGSRRETATYCFEDSGDGNMTMKVYRHCLGHEDDRVRPIKGDLSGNDYFHANMKTDQPHGGLLIRLNSVLIKDTLSAWMDRDPSDPHAVSFPPEVREDVDFQTQIIAEERTVRATPTGERAEWVATGPNHYGDAIVYGSGAAIFEGIIEAFMDGQEPEDLPASQPARRSGGFVGGFSARSEGGRSWLG